MKKLKAFTLIELIIVIVIISVLMAATMRFGWDRIRLLNNKNIQEQFLSSFSSLQAENNMTNYHLGKNYQELKINFLLWEKFFSYSYHNQDSILDSKTTSIEWWNYKISKIILDWNVLKEANILMKPYTLWCTITNNDGSSSWKNLKLWILVNDNKEYCFSIESNNCKIKTIFCSEMENLTPVRSPIP